ncbi:hypothetical protein ACLQ3D_09785 [Micromonospora vinacea]|uniref:hypothetical protein n=1 Tax=Micromonospora vinacea TaxID=709878 RepID=UPI003CFB0831|nr:hypothetical protein OHB51_25520 [Micromonospora sp. NBC_00855]
MGSSLAINPRGGLCTDRGEKLEEVKGNGDTVDYSYFLDGLLKSQTEKKSNGTTLVSEDERRQPRMFLAIVGG